MSLKNDSAQFGGPVLKFTPLNDAATILSREMTTVKLQISSPTVTTTSIQPTTPTPPSDIEKEALKRIKDDEELLLIYNLVPEAEYNYFIIAAININTLLYMCMHTPNNQNRLKIARLVLFSSCLQWCRKVKTHLQGNWT